MSRMNWGSQFRLFSVQFIPPFVETLHDMSFPFAAGLSLAMMEQMFQYLYCLLVHTHEHHCTSLPSYLRRRG